jgi:hypothetical protein
MDSILDGTKAADVSVQPDHQWQGDAEFPCLYAVRTLS